MVDAGLQTPQFFNFYIYELKNICKDYVINFLAHVLKSYSKEKNCFYIHSGSYDAKTQRSKTQTA